MYVQSIKKLVFLYSMDINVRLLQHGSLHDSFLGGWGGGGVKISKISKKKKGGHVYTNSKQCFSIFIYSQTSQDRPSVWLQTG